MTPQPTAHPPPDADNRDLPRVRIRQAILDRRGRPYMLHGCFDTDRCRFTIHTTDGAQVGVLELRCDVPVGQIVSLQLEGSRLRLLPDWGTHLLARLTAGRIGNGHRGHGLGSLLVIYALKAACELHLREVRVAAPIPPAAHGLFRNLGFTLEPDPAGTAAFYPIVLSPHPRHDHP